MKNSVRRLLDMRLQASFLRSATLVAANSCYTEHEVRRFAGSETRIVVLPPPVPRAEGQGRGPIRGRVLIAGRLTAFKGAQDAIRAMASVPDEHLCIAGDGPYRPVLERLVDELNVRSRVSFLGWVSREALDAEMQASQVILFPSTWPETFGQVGVQAALAERPVIAYDTGGVRDWLSDKTGILVPVGDIDALAAGTRELLSDPERCRDLGERARRAAERFELGPFADRVEDAMRQAAILWQGERL